MTATFASPPLLVMRTLLDEGREGKDGGSCLREIVVLHTAVTRDAQALRVSGSPRLGLGLGGFSADGSLVLDEALEVRHLWHMMNYHKTSAQIKMRVMASFPMSRRYQVKPYTDHFSHLVVLAGGDV